MHESSEGPQNSNLFMWVVVVVVVVVVLDPESPLLYQKCNACDVEYSKLTVQRMPTAMSASSSMFNQSSSRRQ